MILYSDNKKNMINTKRNTDESANWKAEKSKLRTEFPTVTDEDLNYDFSKKNEMLEKLSVKLGKTRAELLSVIGKR